MSSEPPKNDMLGPPKNTGPKPQAASHMFWFFILPCILFLAWASFKLINGAMQPKPERDVFAKLQDIRSARSAGDRWQAAYGVSQELQKLIHENKLNTLSEDKKNRLYGELTELLNLHATDSRLKRYLLLTLGQMGEVRALPALETGLNDKDPEIKFFSAWGYIDILSKNPNATTPERLEKISLWLNDSDPALKKVAATFLVQQKNPALIGRVERQLRDSDREVRWNAAVALASVQQKAAKTTLLEMFDLNTLRDSNPKSTKDLAQLVSAAYQAAKKLNDPEVLSKIEKLKSQVNATNPEGQAILSALQTTTTTTTK